MNIAPYDPRVGGNGRWKIENEKAGFYTKQTYTNALTLARCFVVGETYEFTYEGSGGSGTQYFYSYGKVPEFLIEQLKIYQDEEIGEEFRVPLTLEGIAPPTAPPQTIADGSFACLDGSGFAADEFPETVEVGTTFTAVAGGNSVALAYKLAQCVLATGRFTPYTANAAYLDSRSLLEYMTDENVCFNLRWVRNARTGRFYDYPSVQGTATRSALGIES